MATLEKEEFNTVAQSVFLGFVESLPKSLRRWVCIWLLKKVAKNEYNFQQKFREESMRLFPHRYTNEKSVRQAGEQAYKNAVMETDLNWGENKMQIIRAIAEEFGYTEIDIPVQERGKLISFKKELKDHATRINIYHTTMTVGTCLKHPKYESPTQLFRKHVTEPQLRKIFENPRTHTNKGYYKK